MLEVHKSQGLQKMLIFLISARFLESFIEIYINVDYKK